MRQPHFWTEERRQELVDYVDSRMNEGATAKESLKDAAIVFEKTERACTVQYYKKAKELYTEQTSAPLIMNATQIYAYVIQLEKENVELRKAVEASKQNNEDFASLLTIMEKARKLAFVGEEAPQGKFKMDQNGNLERC